MTAFNVVRFRLKPGGEEAFMDAHGRAKTEWPGLRRFTIVKAAENSVFVIGEWDSMEAMAAARPGMIGILDSFRHTLEDLGGGLGMTDPISGTVVMELTPGR